MFALGTKHHLKGVASQPILSHKQMLYFGKTFLTPGVGGGDEDDGGSPEGEWGCWKLS